MDSRVATYEHIHQTQLLLNIIITCIMNRGLNHDQSKLESPEVELFNEYTVKLKGSTYGSAEYNEFLKGMAPALTHHYENNSHHPEHYVDGIHGMDLVDMVEMICDWKAATMRHADGDIIKSIEINQKRFGYSDDLKQIFINTVKRYL